MVRSRGRPAGMLLAAVAGLAGAEALNVTVRGSSRQLLQTGVRQPTGGCPELIPLSLSGSWSQVSSSGQLSVFFEAWCNLRPLGGLALAPCGAHAHFSLVDDGLAVSRAETQVAVSPPPGSVLSLILLDMSNSIRQANALASLKEAVRAYVNRALASTRATGPHDIAIWAFDGRMNPQPIVLWTGGNGDADRVTIYSALDALQCGVVYALGGAEYCADPSTNLHGALVWGAEEIKRRTTEVQSAGRAYVDRFLVFYTDGSDQADRVVGGATYVAQVLRSSGATVYGVGIGGERVDGTTGISETELRVLTGDFPGETFVSLLGFNALSSLFDQAAAAAVTYASRYYRIDYCSPRRSGTHTLNIHGVVDGRLGDPLSVVYDTAGFVEPVSCYAAIASVGACAESRQLQAAHGCTGCSRYNCDTLTCECGSGQCSQGQCIGYTGPTDDSIAVTQPTDGLARCTAAVPPGPQSFASFTQSPNSQLTLTFDAICGDGTPIDGLSFSSCQSLSSLTVTERGSQESTFVQLSQGESRARIECLPSTCEIVSLVLMDTSGSVRGCHGLESLRSSVLGYLEGVVSQSSTTHRHTMAVHAFDGRAGTQQVLGFTADTAAVQRAVRDFACGGVYCQDPATNLYGAVERAEATLQAQLRLMALQRFQAYIIVFSDGTDTAARAGGVLLQNGVYAWPDSFATIAQRRTVYAVGVRGDDRSATTGVYEQSLRVMAPGRAVFLDSPVGTTSVPESWRQQSFMVGQKVGEEVTSACCRSSRYQLTYCSPKREGRARVRVELRHASGSTYWEHEFDASAFNCGGGLCSYCGEQSVTASCAAQPAAATQLFSCAGDRAPVVVNGYCRCPCDTGSYPTTAGPGPITCPCQRTIPATPPPTPPPVPIPTYTPPPPTAAPTCAAGVQPNCAYLPVAPQQPAFFTAFSNSRISLEFDVFCGDGQPIPGLRFSACPALSDFSLFESNEQGEFRNVSLWESMPRVVCTPDVVSLVLLDTSGSVRLGEGLASLKSAVASFLDAVAAEVEVQHTIAVYSFDGRRGVQRVVDFTNDLQLAKTQVSSFNCDNVNYCVDPSTNLNGAVTDAEAILRLQVRNLESTVTRDGQPVASYQPYLILFTDGTDQAGYATHQFAVQSLADGRADYRLAAYSIGLQGETGSNVKGIDTVKLSALAVGGDVYIAADTTQLAAQFTTVGQRIAADVQGASGRRYRVDYCSPKRTGVRKTRVVLSYGRQRTWWEGTFDADTFDCADGACSRCLQRSSFSCQRQPRVDQQFFACDSGVRPIDVSGTCRCPCPAGTPYPPLEGGPTPPPRSPEPTTSTGPTPVPTTPPPTPTPPVPAAATIRAQLAAAGFAAGMFAPNPSTCSLAALGTMIGSPVVTEQGDGSVISMLYSGNLAGLASDAGDCFTLALANALSLPQSMITCSFAAASIRIVATVNGTTLAPTSQPTARTAPPTAGASSSDDDSGLVWILPVILGVVVIIFGAVVYMKFVRGPPAESPMQGQGPLLDTQGPPVRSPDKFASPSTHGRSPVRPPSFAQSPDYTPPTRSGVASPGLQGSPSLPNAGRDISA